MTLKRQEDLSARENIPLQKNRKNVQTEISPMAAQPHPPSPYDRTLNCTIPPPPASPIFSSYGKNLTSDVGRRRCPPSTSQQRHDMPRETLHCVSTSHSCSPQRPVSVSTLIPVLSIGRDGDSRATIGPDGPFQSHDSDSSLEHTCHWLWLREPSNRAAT